MDPNDSSASATSCVASKFWSTSLWGTSPIFFWSVEISMMAFCPAILRAFVAEQFRRLYEKDIKTILVSGHHDTPRSVEQGASPLAVHARSGHVYFIQEQHPTSKKFNFGSEAVNVTGMSLNPSLPADAD